VFGVNSLHRGINAAKPAKRFQQLPTRLLKHTLRTLLVSVDQINHHHLACTFMWSRSSSMFGLIRLHVFSLHSPRSLTVVIFSSHS